MSEPKVTFDVETIPDELKDRDQWLHWDASADKPRRPHAHGDFSVGWNNPDDWLPFDEAVAAARDHETWGIGYVFANGNDEYLRGLYSGIDLDGCLQQTENGPSPKDWLPPLSPFNDNTYIELSPSGTGLHIPLVGIDIPDWWENVHFSEDEHEGVEAYDSKFFTFTGEPLETAADDIGEIPKQEIYDWLAEVYERIAGVDPREQYQPKATQTPSRETKKDRSHVESINTTNNYDDILDAVDHLNPSDLPLSSSYHGDENREWESWDPSYRQSSSGTSLKRNKRSGLFLDFAESSPKDCTPFGPLDLFAAERGTIRRPYDRLQGEDFKAAVEAAREKGAPIPEYVGTDGDLPEEQELNQSSETATGELVWDAWSSARKSGSLTEEDIIPTPALCHIAREHTGYPDDQLPDDDTDELPWLAKRYALRWLKYQWGPDALDIDPTDEDGESVTARSRPSTNADDVHTWEAVRRVYDDQEKEDGRYAAVRLLRDRNHFLTPEDTERLHVYVPELGIYDRGAKYDVGRTLDRKLRENYSTHEKKEILDRLKQRKVERDELEAGEQSGNYVCVENGVLDLDERELLDHDPKWLFTTRLPIPHEPDAEATRIQQFLTEVTRREADRKVLLEMVGNCLLDDYDYESFLVLFGEGSNGKSTWFEVVREFLGEENVESMTLQQITDNRFAASNLVGKWANIGEDLPQKKIHDLGTLKDLTGGGETWVEPKGKDGFSFRNRSKMMFAANKPPVLGERSKAVSRRLLPIRLPYQFTTDPDDDHKDAQKEGLIDELTAEEQLSGLLNLALDGLERLRTKGDFSMPETHEERLEYYEQFSDHIKMFAVNCLENEGGEREFKSDIYDAYTAFCDERGHEKVTAGTFWQQLRKTTLNISEIRPPESEDGSRRRMVDNLTFSDVGAELAPNYDFITDAENISTLAPGDENVTVEGRVASVDRDTPPEIACRGAIEDKTGTLTVTVWSDADVPDFVETECYRLKNVEVSEHQGERQILVGNRSGVEEIAAGVGNAPTEDPGNNEQLDDSTGSPTATDGGDITQLEPRVVQRVNNLETERDEAVPHDLLVGSLVTDGEDPSDVEHAIESAREKGEIYAPKSDHYRRT